MPGSGDSVQALKAGIMEIPDVLAINKKDHPAAKTMLTEVRSVLGLDPDRAWKPPIVLTEALRGEGVDGAVGARSRSTAPTWRRVASSSERRRRNLAGEVFAVASARAKVAARGGRRRGSGAAPAARRGPEPRLDPLSAVREIIDRVLIPSRAKLDGAHGDD